MDQDLIDKEASRASAIFLKDRLALRGYFEELAKEKSYSREDIYFVMWRIVSNDPKIVDQHIADDVGESLTGLLGHCARECITRLATDPTGMTDEEFVAYVRNQEWATDPTKICPTG